MMRDYVLKCIAYLIAICAIAQCAWSQASLLAEDTIDEIKVNSGGSTIGFTVVRDAFKREQWYYVPNTPRLSEREDKGTLEPEFSLVKYQFDDPQNPGALAEGALLQFGVILAAPADVAEQLRQKIGETKQIPVGQVRVSAMPIKAAEVTLYTPQSNTLLASAPNGNGIAPTFATQKMAFSLPLTAIGSDVYQALIQSNTGIPVAVTYTYNGTTPNAGFKVTVHWDQLYTHYSQDEQIRAEASYFGYFGASYSRSSQQILDDLVTKKSIEVEITAGEQFSMEQVQNYLQPILARINAELVEAVKPPDKINPAQAATPSGAGRWFSGGYSVAMKSATNHKHGDEVFDFHVRSIVERKTIVAGFIGIGSYPQATRDRLVLNSTGTFQRSFFILPEVSDDVGIDQASINIALQNGSNILLTKTATWRPRQGWLVNNQSTRAIPFGLGGFGLNRADISHLTFNTTTTINMRSGSPLNITQTANAFNGSIPVARPQNIIDVVEIDASNLSWKKLDSGSHLELVNVSVRSGTRSFSQALRPQLVNGKWQPPPPSYWVVRNDSSAGPDPVDVTVKFQMDNGRQIQWGRNGNLRRDNGVPAVVLVDSDIQTN